MPFFSAYSGIGAGGINESDNRQPEFRGQFHQTQRLPITFGMFGAEIAPDIFLDIQRMGLGMFLQLFQLVLQFNNRLLEVELMFHRVQLSLSPAARQRWKWRTDKEPDLHPALCGDEVYTPSPRRSEG